MKKDVKSIVSKIIEGADVRESLTKNSVKVVEAKSKKMTLAKISDYIDFDYQIVAENPFVWYEALMAISKEINDDFEANFETDEYDYDWETYFDKRWGVIVEESQGFYFAPDCSEANIDSGDLVDYAFKNNPLITITSYSDDIYAVVGQID